MSVAVSDIAIIHHAVQLLFDAFKRLSETPAPDRPLVFASEFTALAGCNIQNRSVLVTMLTVFTEQLRHIVTTVDEPSRGIFSLALPFPELLARFEQKLARYLEGVNPCRSPAADRALQIRHFIDAHYSEPLTLQRVADAVGRERAYVATSFRRETGLTLHRYLAKVRMQHAAELIWQGEKVDAVVLLVGYKSKKNFYRQFKSQMGLTPGLYRRLATSATNADVRMSDARTFM